jgi:hypothetical protein
MDRYNWGQSTQSEGSPASSFRRLAASGYFPEVSPTTGIIIMEREVLDRAEAISQRLLELRDSL